MSIELTGTAGLQFDIRTVDTDTGVGEKDVTYVTPTTVKSVTFTDASIAVAMAGAVGTTPATIDLTAIANVTAGSDTLAVKDNTAPVALASVLTLFVVNTSANVVTLQAGATNSFLTASEQVTIPAGAGAGYSYASGKATSGSIKNIRISADVNDSDCEVYILGN